MDQKQTCNAISFININIFIVYMNGQITNTRYLYHRNVFQGKFDKFLFENQIPISKSEFAINNIEYFNNN